MILVTTPLLMKAAWEYYPMLQSQVKVFNVCSSVDVGEQIHVIPTIPYTLDNIDTVINQLFLTNDDYFIEIFKIINAVVAGYNIFLLVYLDGDVLDTIVESICSFIRDRYGYNYQMISTIDDINIFDQSNLNYNGTVNYTYDYKRYNDYLIANYPDLIVDTFGGD